MTTTFYNFRKKQFRRFFISYNRYGRYNKNAKILFCKFCDFKCYKQCDWTRHILRPKHLINSKRYNFDINNNEKTPDDSFQCDCGKSYKYSSGLWRHKKNCEEIEKAHEEKTPENLCDIKNFAIPQITPELIIQLIEQNKELQQTLIDQNKTIMELAQKAGTNNSNINSNNNNKTFNLQFFLNETCKDAVNLTDFVNQIKLSLHDLEETGKLGYVEGISKVFIENLNEIDFTSRPIHCSDSKR